MSADTIFTNGRITTLDPQLPEATAVAVKDGRITAIGQDAHVLRERADATRVVDLGKRRVIPGLNDSHIHVIRGGLSYNAELRWEGVRSVADALEMLRIQAERTPAPQWVRIIGGWNEYQFREKRLPTLQEINEAAPDTPVFILHLYSHAMLNAAALRALGYDENVPSFDRGVVETDSSGRPTGMLVAKPSALILYKSLAAAPPLGKQDQLNSSRQFMRELNRLGVTSAIDAGGGGQNYPDDYAIVHELRDAGQTSLRIAYNLFAQVPGKELSDYERWVEMTSPGHGDDMLKVLGAGENLVWSAADFENFLEPRPDLSDAMEGQLEAVVGLLASRKWPFRIHATYDESIDRFLNVFEKVAARTPFDGLRFIIDHAETISDRSIERVRDLGGGVAIQHRMAFQGEYFLERYGREAIARTPPVRRMLELGCPVAAGSDATRVASYNPWVALYWLTTGRTVGGTAMYPDANLLNREEALRLWTQGSAWVSSDEENKGTLKVGQFADFAALSADFMTVPDEDIPFLESELTVVDGEIVFAGGGMSGVGPEPLPVSPDWSPVARFGGHQGPTRHHISQCTHHHHHHHHDGAHAHGLDVLHGTVDRMKRWLDTPWSVGMGCDCFAF